MRTLVGSRVYAFRSMCVRPLQILNHFTHFHKIGSNVCPWGPVQCAKSMEMAKWTLVVDL